MTRAWGLEAGPALARGLRKQSAPPPRAAIVEQIIVTAIGHLVIFSDKARLNQGERQMERKKASDFPQELLNLFDGYVHGGISRREFLDGAQKFAVGGVTAAALFEMLKPNYAWAVQVPPDDKRIKAENATVPSPQGNGSIKGYLVRPANATASCPPFWSSTRIAASIPTSRMWRDGWRSPISSRSRPTG